MRDPLKELLVKKKQAVEIKAKNPEAEIVVKN